VPLLLLLTVGALSRVAQAMREAWRGVDRGELVGVDTGACAIARVCGGAGVRVGCAVCDVLWEQ